MRTNPKRCYVIRELSQISFNDKEKLLSFVDQHDGLLELQIAGEFSLEALLGCIAEEAYQVDSLALRYYIAKELEEEHYKNELKGEEQSFKMLKHVPQEAHGEFVVAGEIQRIGCKFISRKAVGI